MAATLGLVASVAILSTLPAALITRKRLRKTTLLGPWAWGTFALAIWATTCLVTHGIPLVAEGAGDQLWLAAAVLLVTPFVAVLGARRPGSRVWSFFIVAPMAVVLDLPAATAWNRDLRPARLHLEVPMLAGYALVMLMGAGNYLATRFFLPSMLAAAAGLLVPVSMSSLQEQLPDPPLARALATCLLAAAVWIAAWRVRRIPAPGITPLDPLWIDFRDLYGIVWARRVLDRVNEAAVREGWPVRLQLQGFVPIDPSRPLSLEPDQVRQIEHTLRWLLRRFVEPEWIDERIAGVDSRN